MRMCLYDEWVYYCCYHYCYYNYCYFHYGFHSIFVIQCAPPIDYSISHIQSSTPCLIPLLSSTKSLCISSKSCSKVLSSAGSTHTA